jgi:hypothetical protein
MTQQIYSSLKVTVQYSHIARVKQQTRSTNSVCGSIARIWSKLLTVGGTTW